MAAGQKSAIGYLLLSAVTDYSPKSSFLSVFGRYWHSLYNGEAMKSLSRQILKGRHEPGLFVNATILSNGIVPPYLAEEMMAWPISTRVNSPRNNDPAIIVPIG